MESSHSIASTNSTAHCLTEAIFGSLHMEQMAVQSIPGDLQLFPFLLLTEDTVKVSFTVPEW